MRWCRDGKARNAGFSTGKKIDFEYVISIFGMFSRSNGHQEFFPCIFRAEAWRIMPCLGKKPSDELNFRIVRSAPHDRPTPCSYASNSDRPATSLLYRLCTTARKNNMD